MKPIAGQLEMAHNGKWVKTLRCSFHLKPHFYKHKRGHQQKRQKPSNWGQSTCFADSADLFGEHCWLSISVRQGGGEITVLHAQGPCNRQEEGCVGMSQEKMTFANIYQQKSSHSQDKGRIKSLLMSSNGFVVLIFPV